ncbi:DUF6344 domain-containing protein [Streptomyces sp. NPDC059080]|uniref:DUF6344 domain-containing protein n=1 Tax=Streptomyces sp. NPDC059080 TaxID=3346718 RepID=UPI003674A1E5
MAATKVVKFWAVCLAVLGKLLATFRYAAPGAAACRRAARYGDSLYGATPYTPAPRTTAYVPVAPYAPAARAVLGAPRTAATAPPVPVTGDPGPAPGAPTTAPAAQKAPTPRTAPPSASAPAPAPAPAPTAVTPAARRAPEDHFLPEQPPASRSRLLPAAPFLPSPRIASPYVPEMRAYGGPQLPPTLKQRIRAEAHGSSPTTRSRLATDTEPSRTVPADDPHGAPEDDRSAAIVPAARSREHTACTT